MRWNPQDTMILARRMEVLFMVQENFMKDSEILGR